MSDVASLGTCCESAQERSSAREERASTMSTNHHHQKTSRYYNCPRHVGVKRWTDAVCVWRQTGSHDQSTVLSDA